MTLASSGVRGGGAPGSAAGRPATAPATVAAAAPAARGMLGKCKYFLFDLDGTLVDTTPLIIASFKHTMKTTLGLDLTDEQIKARLGEPLSLTMEFYCRERRDEMVECYREFNITHHDELAKPFPKVRETVAALKERGCHLAVVSSKVLSTVSKGLALVGIQDFFEAVVTMEDTEEHKPNPAPLLEAMRRIDAAPAVTAMVGDSPYDLQAAHNAGVLSVGVGWSQYSRAELERYQPDFIAASMTDLLPLAIAALMPELPRKPAD